MAAFDATQSPFFIVSLTAFSNGDDELAFPVFRRRHGLIETAYAARVEKKTIKTRIFTHVDLKFRAKTKRSKFSPMGKGMKL
ncbi:hypothetical protein C3463_02525 [Serratia marcescens]|uniref:hypothetical protein n=1 Tax=Serratia marcescens TaxID=615 RepID=UPI000CDDC4DA|nr:hypothetical protein [Serratia marcescens]POX29903.1 hypothetical protein C3463_02525 [Serratia marcescens]